MEVKIDVEKIIVVLSDSVDHILIYVNLPPSTNLSKETLLEMVAISNTGAQYVRDNFGIEPKVVDTR